MEDIYKFSTLTDRLHILENTLQWRHMIPTAPDTLSEWGGELRCNFISSEPYPHTHAHTHTLSLSLSQVAIPIQTRTPSFWRSVRTSTSAGTSRPSRAAECRVRVRNEKTLDHVMLESVQLYNYVYVQLFQLVGLNTNAPPTDPIVQ